MGDATLEDWHSKASFEESAEFFLKSGEAPGATIPSEIDIAMLIPKLMIKTP